MMIRTIFVDAWLHAKFLDHFTSLTIFLDK